MKIRNKISLFVIPLTVLPIFLLGIFSYQSMNEAFKQQSYLENQQISLIAKNQIEQILDNARDALLFLSSQLEKRLSSVDKPNPKEILLEEKSSLKLLADNFALRYAPNLQIRFVAANGKELFKTNGLNNKLDLTTALDEGIFLQAVAIGDWRHNYAYQFPPEVKNSSGTLFTTFSYHIVNAEGLIGFIFLDLNLNLFSKILQNVAHNQEGYYLLFDGAGNKLASGGNENILKLENVHHEYNLKLQEVYEKLITSFVHTSLGNTLAKYTVSFRPVKEYIAYKNPRPEERWYLAVLRTRTPLFFAFQRTQILFVIFIILGLSIAILGTFYISKKITNPIGKLTLTTKKFSQGRLDSKIDISGSDEIGDLAADFNKMAKDLKRMMLEVDIHKNLAAIGKFAAGMYHDIKSPLEGLKLLISGMKKKIKENDPNKKYVDEIDLGINNLDQLIQETMDFVRPKSLNLQKVNVNEILRLTVADLKFYNISVKWKLSKNIPAIHIDTNQIKHALVNIINNAVESMPGGGKMTISSATVKKSVCIKISDSGSGIEPDELEKIFQPFFTTKKQGHGLGLSLVHQLIVNHGGDIKIKSEIGKGSEVFITLPNKVEKS
jgi:signal transduction histidine kinase